MKNELTEITVKSSAVEYRVTFYRRNLGPCIYKNLTRATTRRIENLLNDRRDEIDIIFTPLMLLVT